MTLQLLHSEFPYVGGKIYFLFYQCIHYRIPAQHPVNGRVSRAFNSLPLLHLGIPSEYPLLGSRHPNNRKNSKYILSLHMLFCENSWMGPRDLQLLPFLSEPKSTKKVPYFKNVFATLNI
jgi:hypothetical protein